MRTRGCLQTVAIARSNQWIKVLFPPDFIGILSNMGAIYVESFGSRPKISDHPKTIPDRDL
jgi:hypothetical protein